MGILRAAAAALSPSGSMASSKAAPPHSRRVGCHSRVSASVLHAGAGLLRTCTPAAPSTCTTPPQPKQGSLPCFKWQTGLHIGADASLLNVTSYRCGIRWIKNPWAKALSRVASLWLQILLRNSFTFIVRRLGLSNRRLLPWLSGLRCFQFLLSPVHGSVGSGMQVSAWYTSSCR